MLKRLCLAFAGLFALVSIAQGAGTVPGFSLVPQFDLSGKIAPGCKLFVIQAGTVSTPQNAYQDSGLTLLQPNPMLCDAAGRLPQWFVADGNIKLRLTDKNSTQIFVQDGLLVVGASSGGGGGSPVDPTTIFSTGDLKPAYSTSVLSGWVRLNGRTIGSSTSGATERANADVQALFVYLWGVDANLVVSGGRGASGAADWAANKTIALPDYRGRIIAGLDDMGNSAAGRLTSTYFGTSGACSGANAITLGAACGGESKTMLLANLPPFTPAGSISASLTALGVQQYTSSTSGSNVAGALSQAASLGSFLGNNVVVSIGSSSISASFTGTLGGGTSMPFPVVQPTTLATFYIKL
jgi:hypothetical protein